MLYLKYNKYSLKDALLKESILPQQEFFSKLYKYFLENKEVLTKSNIGTFIIKEIKRLDYFNLDKSSKKKAGLEIVKNIRKNFVSATGEPLNIKNSINLHSSILDYISGPRESSFDDCMIAADVFVSDYVQTLSEKEKDLYERGKIKFELVLDKIDFYKKFFEENREVLNLIGDEKSIDYESKRFGTNLLYDKHNIKVYFPRTSISFRHVIKQAGVKLKWCTQENSQWYSYNQDYKLCILINENFEKTDRRYIISLKISEDIRGDNYIDYTPSVDANNIYMQEKDFDFLKELDIEDDLLKIIQNQPKNNANVISEKEEESLLKNLGELKKYKECKNYVDFILGNSGNKWDRIADMLVSLYSNFYVISNKQKTEDVLAEAISSYCYQNYASGEGDNIYDIVDSFINTNLKRNNLECSEMIVGLLSKILEKSKNKRLHEKFTVALIGSLSRIIEDNIVSFNLTTDDIKESIISGCETNNVSNFKLVLCAAANSFIEEVQASLDDEDFRSKLISTKGFAEYLKSSGKNVFVYNPKGIFKLLNQSILSNQATFVEKYNEFNEEKISLESLSLINDRNNLFVYFKELLIYREDLKDDKNYKLLIDFLTKKSFFIKFINNDITFLKEILNLIYYDFIKTKKSIAFEILSKSGYDVSAISELYFYAIIKCDNAESRLSFSTMFWSYVDFVCNETNKSRGNFLSSINPVIKSIILDKLEENLQDNVYYDIYALDFLFLTDYKKNSSFIHKVLFEIIFTKNSLSHRNYSKQEIAKVFKDTDFFGKLDLNLVVGMSKNDLFNLVENISILFSTNLFDETSIDLLNLKALECVIEILKTNHLSMIEIEFFIENIKLNNNNIVEIKNILPATDIEDLGNIEKIKSFICLAGSIAKKANILGVKLDEEYLKDLIRIYDKNSGINLRRSNRQIILGSGIHIHNALLEITFNLILSINNKELEVFTATLERDDLAKILFNFIK